MQDVSCGFTPAIYLKKSLSPSVPSTPLTPSIASKYDYFGGEEVSTPDGECLKYETVHKITPFELGEDEVRKHLMSELTLIPGIGKVRAAEFKRKGVRTIENLKNTRFKNEARVASKIISDANACEVISLFRECHRGNDPLLLGFAGKEPANHVFFDIETLGMYHSPIILMGCGEYFEGGLKVTQYLIRDIDEEPAAVTLAAKHFKKSTSIVTYNGKAFDIPYLNERLSFYGEKFVSFKTHFDLLYPTRKLFSESMPDCRLASAEEYLLGMKRHDDLPGYMVPVYYNRYLLTKNTKTLEPIVAHNESDVANMAILLNHHLEYIYER